MGGADAHLCRVGRGNEMVERYAFFEITPQGVATSGVPESDPTLLQDLVRFARDRHLDGTAFSFLPLNSTGA